MSKLHTEKSNLLQFENDSLTTEKQEAVQGGFFFLFNRNQQTQTAPSTTTTRQTTSSGSGLDTFMRCTFTIALGGRW